MKNILIVVPSLTKNGGVSKVADYQSNLHEFGYNIYYLVLYKQDNIDIHRPKAVDIIFLNEPAKFCFFCKVNKLLKRIYYIKKISRKYNIDLIISHQETSNVPVALSKLTLFNRVKMIFVIHTDLKIYHSNLARFFLSLLYVFNGYVVTVSEGIKSELYFTKIFNSRFKTIYNAIDFNNINIKKNEELTYAEKTYFKKDMVNIISVGRLAKQKNYKMLIKAVHTMYNKNDVHLIIIGDGEEKDSLIKLANQLNVSLCLPGFKENVFKFLRNADIFALTSIYEGFGIVLVEALACKLPVVSTDCDYGPREILCPSELLANKRLKDIEICRHGILTPVNDSDKFAQAVDLVLSDKKLKSNLVENSLKRAEMFGLNNIIKQWVLLIESILGD